ncbi:MAG: hypothetical protein KBD21_02005 [Candidatus Pacebacteria bacterium]|nr:hypothetical protein [Candidatus Paceibacterota bacterium]
MNIFETKNSARIDIDAVKQVILGERRGVWCLDLQSGTVQKCAPNETCIRIPRVTQQKMEQSMREFITESGMFVLDEDDEVFVRTLKRLLTQEHVLGDALKLLRSSGSWMSGWSQWSNDTFWEDLVEWLEDNVPDMTEVLELDCSCGMCHILAENFKHSGDHIRVDWNLDNLSST